MARGACAQTGRKFGRWLGGHGVFGGGRVPGVVDHVGGAAGDGVFDRADSLVLAETGAGDGLAVLVAGVLPLLHVNRSWGVVELPCIQACQGSEQAFVSAVTPAPSCDAGHNKSPANRRFRTIPPP